jgi:hypothetical protein
MPTSNDFFYARAFKGVSEGLYKIYVENGVLHGAKLAGVIYDEASARAVTMSGGLLGFALGQWMGKRAMKKRDAQELAVDALTPGSPSFLAADKSNFTLSSAQMSRVRVFMPQGLMAKLGDKSIAFEITLSNGSKRYFSLVGETDPERVRTLLAKVTTDVETT